jgi:hypothetical protein
VNKKIDALENHFYISKKDIWFTLMMRIFEKYDNKKRRIHKMSQLE